MKVLRTIDNQLLAFWHTTPEDRLWAYLATLPVLVLVIDLITKAF